MALATSVIVNFRDSKGKTSATKVRIPSTFSFSQYLEFAEGVAQVLANLSSAEITSVAVGVSLDLSGASLKALAVTFADVFQKALIVARSTVAGLFARFNLPTFDDSNIPAGTDIADSADVQVAALVTLIEDGLDDGGVFIVPVAARGEALLEVASFTEKFRAS